MELKLRSDKMDLKEIKIELIKQGKTARWLAETLGYTTSYLYDCIKKQNERELERIKKILGV